MSITSSFSESEDILTIGISGFFDISIVEEFTRAYASLPASAGRQYVIDLSEVEYMDSAALGMLLVLREKADQGDKSIVLKGANQDVLKTLEISRFEQLFVIN